MCFSMPHIDAPPPPPPAANPPVMANSTAVAVSGAAKQRMQAAAGMGFENTLLTSGSGADAPQTTAGTKALTGA